MDATLTEEQQLLADAARRLAGDLATTNPDDIVVPDRDTTGWASVVSLGLPSLPSPELSGVEASGVEVAVVLEELARTLVPVPSVGQGVIAPALLDAAGAVSLGGAVAEGRVRLAPVFTSDLGGLAELGDGGVAFDAAGATHGLVVERVDGGRRLRAVDLRDTSVAGALDLTRELRVVAEGSAAVDDLDLGGVIGADGWTVVESTCLVAVAADLLGVMQGALDDAVAYAGDRRQFGVPIGSFQAIQQLVADAHVRVEGSRSCVLHAAWALRRLPPGDALLAARTAKAYAADAGREVVESAVQVFGGIAITWEALTHLRVRRTLLDRVLAGDERHQHEEIGRMRLDGWGA